MRRVLVGLSAITLVACGSPGSGSSSAVSPASSSPSEAAASGTARTASTIRIANFRFTTPDSVSPGATIRVVNEDGTEHTVSSDDGHTFDEFANPGTTTFTAPTEPGSYPFHCSIHPEMHGTLVVK